ncbi:hypothetical protein RHS01_07575 [Rhizoctonia solani]|uniref:Zn(2)-C6 fungal-type domain-containing protein n=1 Tax=Rhizoctonia solani TaxID=456999 RepID=A0A8H7I8H8_9AGAM|nr:hypothetical protein RHS01_07575 [Rhizoctonia solani]
MSRITTKPGPPPTSCLTCRRRRKKCDMSTPFCKTCLRGGYECLGYDGCKPRAKNYGQNAVEPTHPQLKPSLTNEVRSETLNAAETGLPKDKRDRIGGNTTRIFRPPIPGNGMLYRINGTAASARNKHVTLNASMEFNRLWPQDQSQPAVYFRYVSPDKQTSNTGSSTYLPDNGLIPVIEAFCQSVPRSVDATQTMRGDYFGHILHTYHLQRLSYWFSPPPFQIGNFLMLQMLKSKRIVWVTYLAAKVFQLLHQDPQIRSSIVAEHIGWIDKLEPKFTTTSCNSPSLDDIGERLMVHLTLASLKYNLIDLASGYQLLRNSLPKFLQLAAADNTLLIERPDGSAVVSFPHALGASRYELRRFAVIEAVSAFLLGVPPLLEYGYNGECDSEHNGFEWIYGVPVVILQVISQVNSYRAGGRIPLEDWKALEARVMVWKSQYLVTEGASAAKSVDENRAAVLEGWRHVALIYIYMGMCGASSHDSRIQASVDQIIELGKAVGSSRIGIHTLPHCVVVGVAARLEKHRIAVYEQLRSIKGTRIWLFPGLQFSEVLYHLWHGVGLGGAPVTWDYYVQSMCAVISI